MALGVELLGLFLAVGFNRLVILASLVSFKWGFLMYL